MAASQQDLLDLVKVVTHRYVLALVVVASICTLFLSGVTLYSTKHLFTRKDASVLFGQTKADHQTLRDMLRDDSEDRDRKHAELLIAIETVRRQIHTNR